MINGYKEAYKNPATNQFQDDIYTWSQKQAKVSFVLAVSMCIFGLVLMIGFIILSIAFRLSFQMSIIPAVGGVITELIAGTALVVY